MINTDGVQIGQSSTDTNNFLLTTDGAGNFQLKRKTDGSGGTLLTVGTPQTWQDVTGSRAIAGGPYTNSTGRPIKVSVYGTNSNVNGAMGGQVNGVTIAVGSAASSVGGNVSIQFDVPDGATYSVTNFLTTNTMTKWSELR